jgi:NitT/TauT family transport system ATP-binding protein
MSTQPGRIVADVPVPFGRPRRPALRGQPEFLALREQLWSLVRGEVMKVLGGVS